jgi:hypothetical protein
MKATLIIPKSDCSGVGMAYLVDPSGMQGAYLRQRPPQENIPQSRPEKTDADAKFKYEDLFFERRRLFSLYQRRRKGHFGFFRIVAKVEFGQFFAVNPCVGVSERV